MEDVLAAWADTRSLGHASAVEACFSMAAKRGGTEKTERRAIRLWKAQRELVKRHWGKPVPSTRRGVGDGDFKAACAWVADCWDWSFEFSKPDDVQAADLEPWLWPGWCQLKLEEMPDWLEGGPRLYEPSWPEGFRRMLDRAPQVISRASGTPRDGRAGALTPLLAVEGKDSAAFFKVVVEDSWLQDALVELLEEKGSDTRRAVADRMLDHLSLEWPLRSRLDPDEGADALHLESCQQGGEPLRTTAEARERPRADCSHAPLGARQPIPRARTARGCGR